MPTVFLQKQKQTTCPNVSLFLRGIAHYYIMTGEIIASPEQFCEEIAQFTMYMWDFASKFHSWTILAIVRHCHTPSGILQTHKQVYTANKLW